MISKILSPKSTFYNATQHHFKARHTNFHSCKAKHKLDYHKYLCYQLFLFHLTSFFKDEIFQIIYLVFAQNEQSVFRKKFFLIHQLFPRYYNLHRWDGKRYSNLNFSICVQILDQSNYEYCWKLTLLQVRDDAQPQTYKDHYCKTKEAQHYQHGLHFIGFLNRSLRD